MDVYVVRIPIKIVLEAVQLKNNDKMVQNPLRNPIYSPYRGYLTELSEETEYIKQIMVKLGKIR